MTLSAVFCDLDGTLVDTALANYEAYRFALAEFDVPFTQEVFATTWGRDSRDFLPDIAPHLSLAEVDTVRSRKAAHYPNFVHLTRLNSPLLSLLLSMKPTLDNIVLVTTAKRSNVTEVLAHHELTSVFDHVVCGEDTARSKPWADPYLYALDLIGADPAQTLTFEDSESGFDSARRAGIKTIRVGIE